ncbi:hypothetical protein EDB89DRAFT_1901981 [Lactarius sanguifluus]|nr:hypothetical protein EDB89DRAFT_1901981 [Lactarius sanguifluus]
MAAAIVVAVVISIVAAGVDVGRGRSIQVGVGVLLVETGPNRFGHMPNLEEPQLVNSSGQNEPQPKVRLPSVAVRSGPGFFQFMQLDFQTLGVRQKLTIQERMIESERMWDKARLGVVWWQGPRSAAWMAMATVIWRRQAWRGGGKLESEVGGLDGEGSGWTWAKT